MKSDPSWSVLSAGLLLFVAGCGTVREVTEQERAESFRPLEGLTVGPKTIRDHILERSAFLINGAEVADRDHPDRDSFNVMLKGDFDFGTAAAVDRRGYFVTAAHCVDRKVVSLAFVSSTGMKIRDARVVWKGDPSSRTSDFAVLHVTGKLEYVFKWGDEFEIGDTVISAGVGKGTDPDQAVSPRVDFNLDPVGGCIETTRREVVDGLEYHLIFHDSPLMRGNSGGPLINDRGRLLGINFRAIADAPFFHDTRIKSGKAVRPDLDWLKRIIEKDASSGRRGGAPDA